MAIATVDPGAEVRSVDHNSIVGLLNGTANDATTTYAQPVKLYQFDNANTYSLTVGNQDITNGLIAQFQYGTVGAATQVARITKSGIVGQIVDAGAFVVHLESQTTVGASIRGSSPTLDPNSAWVSAFNAITAFGGGTIVLGPYTYLCPKAIGADGGPTWTDNTVIRGAGIDATKILHRPSSSQEPIRFLGNTNSGVCDLTVDGNYSNNTTFGSAEISIDGTHTFAYRVKVTNFNKIGISAGGTDVTVQQCTIDGLAPGSYQDKDTGIFQSLYGIFTPGNTVCRRVKFIQNDIVGLRSAAIIIGGVGFICASNTIQDCHRGDFGLTDGVQGGCIATTLTQTSVSQDTVPQHGVIGFNTIGPMPTVITSGGAIGIELDSAFNVLVIGNSITDVSNVGIKVAASAAASSGVTLVGNTVNSVNTTNNTPALGGSVAVFVHAYGFAINGLTMSNMTVTTCRNVLWTKDELGGTISSFNLANWTLINNTAGWTNDSAASDYQSWGHNHVGGGAVLPYRTYLNADGTYAAQIINAHATGIGAYIQGSTTLVLEQATGTGFGLQLLSTGSVAHGMTALADTAAYATFSKGAGDEGGLVIRGLRDLSTNALYMAGFAPTDNTTQSTAGRAYVEVIGGKKNSTSVTTAAATANLFGVSNAGTMELLVTGNGNIYYDGTTNASAWDEHEDVSLLESVRVLTAPGVEASFSQRLSDTLMENAAVLEATGVIKMDPDTGRPWVSHKDLTGLMIDAIRQLGARVTTQDQKILALSGGAQ